MLERGRIGFRCWDGCYDERGIEIRRALEAEGWLVGGELEASANVLVAPMVAGRVPPGAIECSGPVLVVVVGDDPVRWLEAGADDALAFPVRARELTARLEALMRRTTVRPVTVGPLRIDLVGRSVRLKNRELNLTRLETEMLCYLAEHRERTVSGEELRINVGALARAEGSWARVHVHGIRRKLREAAWVVQTRRAYGYRLAAESAPEG